MYLRYSKEKKHKDKSISTKARTAGPKIGTGSTIIILTDTSWCWIVPSSICALCLLVAFKPPAWVAIVGDIVPIFP